MVSLSEMVEEKLRIRKCYNISIRLAEEIEELATKLGLEEDDIVVEALQKYLNDIEFFIEFLEEVVEDIKKAMFGDSKR